MNVRYFCKWCLVAALAALGTNIALHAALAAPPDPAAAEQGAQVLTRGPVHEAFAETVTFDPQPGIVAPKAPPAAIEELPPDQRPQGANVSWIPGYWAWDDERNDFLWVSGIWRDLPPGRQWMPGYWGQSAKGQQWTSGYWADAQAGKVAYLPEPPTTAEAGPNVAAPSPDSQWLPGSWMWNQNRYGWRPGFWAAAQPDWDWVPSHYVWAPQGYVFVDGYWDHSIGRRGVLFAPVYFQGGLYGQPGFSYSPSIAIDAGVLSSCLFLRPSYQHYYFGDYYAANYGTAGFYPSYSYNSGRFGYDPIFAHERWQHRGDRQWEHGVETTFMNRRDHENARPPRTWTAQAGNIAGESLSAGTRPELAVPFSRLSKNPSGSMRFQSVDAVERKKLAQGGQAMQRQRLEARTAPPATSRLAAKPIADVDKPRVPPPAHVAPKPDSRAEAKPKVTPSREQPQPRTVNRPPLDTPRPQPNAGKPDPQPKAERPAPHPSPVPSAPQPKTERPAPEPRTERPAAETQRKDERPAPEAAAGRPAAGSKQEKGKEK